VRDKVSTIIAALRAGIGENQMMERKRRRRPLRTGDA
jgi:hypothetical protein